jgi:hypothetical protein
MFIDTNAVRLKLRQLCDERKITDEVARHFLIELVARWLARHKIGMEPLYLSNNKGSHRENWVTSWADASPGLRNAFIHGEETFTINPSQTRLHFPEFRRAFRVLRKTYPNTQDFSGFDLGVVRKKEVERRAQIIKKRRGRQAKFGQHHILDSSNGCQVWLITNTAALEIVAWDLLNCKRWCYKKGSLESLGNLCYVGVKRDGRWTSMATVNPGRDFENSGSTASFTGHLGVSNKKPSADDTAALEEVWSDQSLRDRLVNLAVSAIAKRSALRGKKLRILSDVRLDEVNHQFPIFPMGDDVQLDSRITRQPIRGYRDDRISIFSLLYGHHTHTVTGRVVGPNHGFRSGPTIQSRAGRWVEVDSCSNHEVRTNSPVPPKPVPQVLTHHELESRTYSRTVARAALPVPKWFKPRTDNV